MEPGVDPNNYTVKEILTQFVLPSLEDIRSVQTADRAAQGKVDEKIHERIESLEGWRNRLVGALAIITAVLLPVSIPVFITILGAH